MPHLREYISPSQIKSARSCMRKWAAEYCYGMRGPETPSQARGKAIHVHLEAYSRHGTVPPKETLEGKVALVMMQHTPGPETKALALEVEIYVPGAPFGSPKDFYGFIDYVLLDTEIDGVAGILVGDHKSTSDFQYILSEEELRVDPQALIYCAAGILKYTEVHGKPPGIVRFQHTYGRTKGSAQAALSYVDMTPDEVFVGLVPLGAFAAKMLSFENTPLADVPFNEDACGMYGGCHLRPECAKLGVRVFGNKPEDVAISKLLTTRLDAPQPVDAVSKLLTRAKSPTSENPMGRFRDAVTEATPAVPATPPADPPVAAPVAAPAEPAAFALNPPDGDALGVSGLVSTPDVVEDVEDTAPLSPDDLAEQLAEAPTTAPEAPTADPAYVVAPVMDTKGMKGAIVRTAVADMFRTISGDPLLLAQLDLLKSDRRVKWLMEGAVASLRNNSDWVALKETLSAVLEANRIKPPEPRAIMPPKPKQQVVPGVRNEVEESATVMAAIAVQHAAVSAQIEAKNTLALVSTVLKDLIDGDDEARLMEYQTSTFTPAKHAAKLADQQVVAADAALADARAAALAQLQVAKAREAETKAAAANADTDVKTPALAVPVTASGDRPTVVGIPTPALFIGSAPTRLACVHIEDIIAPFRRQVEIAHQIAYYGAIRGDGANRVCEAILAALQTGTYVLPPIVVVPAMHTNLASRVLEAIRPYFAEGSVFEAMR